MNAAQGRPKQARSRSAGQAAGRRVHQCPPASHVHEEPALEHLSRATATFAQVDLLLDKFGQKVERSASFDFEPGGVVLFQNDSGVIPLLLPDRAGRCQ